MHQTLPKQSRSSQEARVAASTRISPEVRKTLILLLLSSALQYFQCNFEIKYFFMKAKATKRINELHCIRKYSLLVSIQHLLTECKIKKASHFFQFLFIVFVTILKDC